MKSFNYTITDQLGIHARPAGELVKLMQGYSSEFKIQFGPKEANGKRLFALMGMAVKKGDTIKVCVEGADESAACTALQSYMKNNL